MIRRRPAAPSAAAAGFLPPPPTTLPGSPQLLARSTIPGSAAGVIPAWGETACIITSHNYGHYLGACLASCFAQTVPFAQVLVVDDGSDDDIRDVAGAYPAGYLRVEHREVAAARNAGAEALPASSFLLFVDADNVLPRDYHERLRNRMTTDRVGAVYGSLSRFTDDGGELGFLPQVRPFSHHGLRRGNLADACALVRREAYTQAGGWRSTPGGLDDWLLWLNLTRAGWTLEWEPAAALRYRVHPASMSHGYGRRREADLARNVAVFRSGMLTAVLTLFSGRGWALDRYLEALQGLDWDRENLHLVALDNSADPGFSRALRAGLSGLPCAYTYLADPSRIEPDTAAAAFADSRERRHRQGYALNAHLARLYSRARQHMPAAADLVWAWEDDIIPPRDALTQLCRGLWLHPQAGAITGAVRSRFGNQLVAWRSQGGASWEVGSLREAPPAGQYERLDAAGFHCTLFRREAFEQLAFRPAVTWEFNRWPAFDWAAMDSMRRAGHELYLSGSVRCEHWQADGTCV